MLQWIQAQIGTVISALILLGIITLIVVLNISKKRKSTACETKSSGGCGGGCADCPMRGSCH